MLNWSFLVKIVMLLLKQPMLYKMLQEIYINDKPTGAVVGMQPFAAQELRVRTTKLIDAEFLLRCSPATIKEILLHPQIIDIHFRRIIFARNDAPFK
jgi:hypothetical protein